MEFNFIELLGYLATFFVAVSFLFYSLIIKSYPVALLNAFLVFVNLYQLYRLKKEQPASKVLK